MARCPAHGNRIQLNPSRAVNLFGATPQPDCRRTRDKGFLISIPGRWGELHARGQKLLRQGIPADQIPKQLGLTPERWVEIAAACSVRVVAMASPNQEFEL